MKVPLATFGASVKSIGAGPTAGSAIANAVYSIVPGIDASGLTLYSAVMLGAALGLLVQLTFVSRTVAFYKKLAELEILVHTNRMTKKRALEVRDELETRYFLGLSQGSERDNAQPREEFSKEKAEQTEGENRGASNSD
jgi:hypothetical protein